MFFIFLSYFYYFCFKTKLWVRRFDDIDFSLFLLNLNTKHPNNPILPQNTIFAQKPKKIPKNTTIDYQSVTKKVQKKCKKNARIFGQFKKKQYLCTRFRLKTGKTLKNDGLKLLKS